MKSDGRWRRGQRIGTGGSKAGVMYLDKHPRAVAYRPYKRFFNVSQSALEKAPSTAGRVQPERNAKQQDRAPEATAMGSKNQIVTHLRNWSGDEVQRQKSWKELSDSESLTISGLDVGDDDFDVERDGTFKGRIRLLVWKPRKTAAGTAGIESRVHGVTIEGSVSLKQVKIREFVIDRESETDLLKDATVGYRHAAE